MKRIALCLLLLSMLGGCGFLQANSYVAVEPHNENYGVTNNDDILTVTSYPGLKNAIGNMVQDGMEEGVIRAEAYSGNLSVDLSQAVNEVSRLTPLGAYAVANMTYDFSRIISYYEIHVSIAYRRTPEEMQNITFVTDNEGVTGAMEEAIEENADRLVLRVGNYTGMDLEAVTEQICLDHPESALEKPDVSVELYPDSGSQRILDIKLTYAHDGSEMAERRSEMADRVAELASLYGTSRSDMTNARRLYNRLGRDAVLQSPNATSLTMGAYGALMEGKASALGFAQAYRLLLSACNIPCRLVEGQRLGSPHYWCLVQLDGNSYYVDPSLAAADWSGSGFLMDTQDLARLGYVLPSEDFPETVLPPFTIPVMPPDTFS